MAPSVLGKRARTVDSHYDPFIPQRVKRRAPTSIINDENVDPAAEQESDGEEHQSLQLPTPKTPRKRDALSKRIPVTPRHRLGLVGRPSTPRTPRTPSTPASTTNVYNNVRRIFSRSADPGRLIGREEERQELRSFIQQGLESKSGGCMYVSGPPGTGKSALVSEICHDLQHTEGVRMAYINCMSIKSANDLRGTLVAELFVDNDSLMGGTDIQLEALFIPKKKKKNEHLTYLVTLDEVDHLLTLDLGILYNLFGWSLQRASRLIVIGIANALDLTDRFLPHLKARNLRPQLLPFLPYTAPQIMAVITTKLKSSASTDGQGQSDYVPFLHPAAIQLCAKKVASQTGDLRKAFDIVRKTIDLIETETKLRHEDTITPPDSPSKQPLAENPNIASPNRANMKCAPSLTLLTPVTAPRATIAHVSRISAAAFSHGTAQRLRTLNLQQKAGICALISHGKSARKATATREVVKTLERVPTIRRLYETYCALCKREDALHPLTATEFADVMSGLETLGLVGGEGGAKGLGVRSTPTKKISAEPKKYVSFVDQQEIEGCLDGVGGSILRGLLNGD